MVGTVEAVKRNLLRDGFVDRYPTRREVDGLPPGEGSYLPCTFWLADNLALQGRTDEAREIFERLLALRNAACPHYADISPRNRVPFRTRAAAERAGYRAARNCP